MQHFVQHDYVTLISFCLYLNFITKIFLVCPRYGAPNGSKIVFWKGRYFFRDRDTSCGKGDTSSEIEILLAESEILF